METQRPQRRHEGHEPLPGHVEAAASSVGDASIAVHRALDPGLLESTYEACLAHELERRGRKIQTQVALPVAYQGVRLKVGYRLDLVVDDEVVVEVKAIDAFAPVHDAQLLTYLRLSGKRLGFLINFNVPFLKQGIKRAIL